MELSPAHVATAAPNPAALDAEEYRDFCDLARSDPFVFFCMVAQDNDGRRVVPKPFHADWFRAIQQNERLILRAAVDHGKTAILTSYALWRLGRNPNDSIAYVCETHEPAAKVVRTAKQYIEKSVVLHDIFPKLRPGAPWGDAQFYVQRTAVHKDPSFQAFGIDSGQIQGARLGCIILDDAIGPSNVRTQKARDEVFDLWVKGMLLRRLLEHGKFIFSNAPWDRDDAQHRLEREGWPILIEPAVGDDGKPIWPERFSPERLEKIRTEELGPIQFARQFLCRLTDSTTSRFKAEWIERCKARGRGKTMQSQYRGPLATYTGVDLSTGKNAFTDLTVLFTIALHPDGSRELLNIDSGRWQAPEIVRKIIDCHGRYGSILFVESTGQQVYIAQWTRRESAIPVKTFETNAKTKHDPKFGLESLAIEIEAGKWIIPNDVTGKCHPEVQAWIDEMLFYDPTAHTGDRLIASWLAREAARAGLQRGPVSVATGLSRR